MTADRTWAGSICHAVYSGGEITMCVGLSAKVVRISDGTAVVDAGEQKRSFCRTSGRIWNREIM